MKTLNLSGPVYLVQRVDVAIITVVTVVGHVTESIKTSRVYEQ